MAEPSSTPNPTPPSPGARVLPRGDSRKRLVDDLRRDRFKDRAKDLERGISAPSLNITSDMKVPMAPLPLNESEVVTVGHGMGHTFSKKTFFQPTYCHYCSELLWGLRGQGYLCKVCNYVSHEKCIPFLKTPCRHLLADAIQDPVAHKWTKPVQLKKKHFCNVCRKKICSESVLCEVCKYYTHKSCKENAFNDCKQCATYSFGASSDGATHHWIEGNLPSSARCQVCTKNCSSTDCLTGYRCGWCGIEVHSKCLVNFQAKNQVCTFRDLWGMMLLPQAISHRHVLHCDSGPNTPSSPGVMVDDCGEEEEEEEGEDIDGGGKKRPCIVVDGRSTKGFKKWRKTTVHPTSLTKKITVGELLTISVRKCGISEDISDYFLAEMIDGVERELKLNEIPYDLQPGTYGILRLHLRHKSCNEEGGVAKGRMRINNGHLGASSQLVVVAVTTSTTAKRIVKQALVKFGMESESSDDFCLVEVSQITGVREKVLADTDCPWKKIHELRRDSLTLSSRQRYYIRYRKGGETSTFLRGVAKDILQDKEKYTEYVMELLSEAPDFSVDHVEIGPSFPTLGGMILTFPTFELATKLCLIIEENPNAPKIIMLPSIYLHATSMTQEPLLVFINGKSGGNQGVELISAFRRHLNPHQIWDLSQGGPIPGLWAMRRLTQFRILIGGGDGTFGWVLGALQEMKEYLTCKDPPSALLPLGTGNDLARALKWGGGYGGEKVMSILLSLEDANVVFLDRWNVSIKSQQLPSKEKVVCVEGGPPTSVVMNNYMGIGLDAAIALDFHLAREENPEKFSSRLHNKGFYLQLGLQKMVIKDETRELQRHMTLTVDDKRIDLPDIAGLIILNIQSWGAGADPWGSNSDSMYKPATYDDGLLEVVGLKGVMQMGQVQSGIRNAVRIAQGNKFQIDLLSSLPMQVDGEAWATPPSIIDVEKLPNSAAMLQCADKIRKITDKEMISRLTLLHTVSSPGLEFSQGLSSRRNVGVASGISPTTEFPG